MTDAVRFLAGPAEGGRRLDVVVHGRLAGSSRARVQDWIRAGRVLVNGAPARASYTVREGDAIEAQPAPPPPLRAHAEEIPLRILYEDEDVVAVDKPAGMVVHAGAGVHAGTLVNALLHRFGALSGVGGPVRPGIVHRLDRFTSGVLLVAKNDAAHQSLAHQFASRRVRKTYLALAVGELPAAAGRIEKPIARDPVRRVRMTARLASGRAAWSEYKVLRRLPGHSLLEVLIGTGRTHQIRVHLASIGHPVAGDRLYGAPAQPPGQPVPGRYFLHAHRICYASPATGQPVEVVSPLPEDLQAWLAALARAG
jgi:23S rRNA pseudouridine1911/1915/1917 synthase